jgi:uncharacterized protein
LTDLPSSPSTAFRGPSAIAKGSLAHVALAVREALEANQKASILVFDDETGAVVDLDLRGTAEAIVARLEERARGQQRRSSSGVTAKPETSTQSRGRPKLGVLAREVTLLPRHWAWLSAQPGGASNALRHLTEKAMRDDEGKGRLRTDREAAYRFMSTMAGDLPGFEEASRALFAADRDRFERHSGNWPQDVRSYALKLAWREP